MVPDAIDKQAWMEQDALDKMAEAIKAQRAADLFAVAAEALRQASLGYVLHELAQATTGERESALQGEAVDFADLASWPEVMGIITAALQQQHLAAAEVFRR